MAGISIRCSLCHDEVVLDGMVNYEDHLKGWHRITDVGERKKVMARTLKKFSRNNEAAEEDNDDSQIEDRDNLSDKVEKALKASNNEKNQFTFEDEDFVVSASFVDYLSSQEDIESNPDATTVERVDFDDVSGSYLLEAGNVELEDGIIDEGLNVQPDRAGTLFESFGGEHFNKEDNCEVNAKIDDILESRLSKLSVDLESEVPGESVHQADVELEGEAIDESEIVKDASKDVRRWDKETLCDEENNNEEVLNIDNDKGSSIFKEIDLNDNDQVVKLGKNGLQNDASPTSEPGLIIDEEVETGNSREDDTKVCSVKASTGIAEKIDKQSNVENAPLVVKVPW